MDWLIIVSEGVRMFKRNLRIRKKGFPQYKGNAEQVCKQIVDKCWNGKYFETSYNGNYPEFYCRDFGMATRALLKLGHKGKVRKTLEYALSTFKKHNRITTTINPKGKPFNFPTYGPDSLAFLLHSIFLLGDKNLVERYKIFLNEQVKIFFNKVVDKNGLPKKKHFSSMKDYSLRKASCYNLCMCYVVQKYSRKLGLVNPLKKFDYEKLLMKYYWTGEYFLDDLSGKTYISGDANTLPLWTGLVKDKKIMKKVVSAIRKHKLDEPFPLRYTKRDNTEVDMHWLEIFAKDWERHVLWLHLGYLYIEAVAKVDKKLSKQYIQRYEEHIERFKNHLEVFEPDGKPYNSRFFYSSDSMLWAANYLILK